MSKILIRKSDLTRLVENLLLKESLLIEDTTPETSVDDKTSEDETDDVDDEAEEGEDYMTQVKRVAGNIVDKVSSGASAIASGAGVAYDKAKELGKSVKEKGTKYKDDIKKLSGDDGLITSFIEVGESLYDLGDVAGDVAMSGARRLSAVGQNETDIKRHVIAATKLSQRASQIQTVASENSVAGAGDTDISWFDRTPLGGLLLYDNNISYDYENGSYFMYFFANTIQALKDSYFALDRKGMVPKIENYGATKYEALRGKDKKFFENYLVSSINKDLTALVKRTNSFHESVREKSTDIETFINALTTVLFATNDDSRASINTIKANILNKKSRNFEPYVNQVYASISQMLEECIGLMNVAVEKVNEGLGATSVSIFRREGKYFSEEDYPPLYYKLNKEKVSRSISKIAKEYNDLASSSVFAGSKGTFDASKELASAMNRPLTRLLGDVHPNPSKFEKSKKK